MKPREVVYIAAPYAAPTVGQIARNVARAIAVGRLAADRGLAPLVPHAIGWLGVHGPRDESAAGVRDAAIGSGEALAAMVGAHGGRLWIVSLPNGTLSSGCSREMAAYAAAYREAHDRYPPESLVLRRRWERWSIDVRSAGIRVPAVADVLDA